MITFDVLHSIGQERERAGIDVRVFVAYEDREIVAALPVYTVRRETHGNYDPDLQLTGERGDRPVCHVGSRHGYNNVLLFPDNWRNEHGMGSVSKFFDFIRSTIEETNTTATSWLPYLCTEDMQFLRAALNNPPTLLLKSECKLDLPGEVFDDYLGGFTTSRRGAVRRDRRKFAEAGFTTATTDFASSKYMMAQLGVATVERHGGDLTVDQAISLTEAQVDLNDVGLVFLVNDSAGPVGFASALFDDAALYMRSAGFDYARLRNACEYFEALFYSPIEYAYAHGLHEVWLGPSGYKAKVLRGANVEPRWALPLAGSWNEEAVNAANRNRIKDLEIELHDFPDSVPIHLVDSSHTRTPALGVLVPPSSCRPGHCALAQTR
jgi:hypothetical protein